MKVLLLSGLMIFLSSCTYSIALVHTQGTASDVVDETSNPQATATVPLTL